MPIVLIGISYLIDSPFLPPQQSCLSAVFVFRPGTNSQMKEALFQSLQTLNSDWRVEKFWIQARR